MSVLESDKPLPHAKCEEGRVVVKLPQGEWDLEAICAESHTRLASVRKEVEKKEILPTPGRYVTASRSTQPFHKALREEMVEAFDVEELRLISADVGLGSDFIGSRGRASEAHRLIDKCMQHGRRKMEKLLIECQERRPDRDFPDLPKDKALW